MINVDIQPNEQDIAAVQRMFARLQNEGRKSFDNAIAWTAWYVGRAIGAKTAKERKTKRKLHRTTPSMQEVEKVAARLGRTPAQVAGYYNYYVERFTRKGDGSTWNQLINRDDDINAKREIKNRGFSKKTWAWMASAAKRKGEKRERSFYVLKVRDITDPGYQYTNKIKWMHRIITDLSGVYGNAERAMAKYFERAAINAAKRAGA